MATNRNAPGDEARSSRREVLRHSLLVAGASVVAIGAVTPGGSRASAAIDGTTPAVTAAQVESTPVGASAQEDHAGRVAAIQELLRRYDIPAWLFYDFRVSNRIAYRALALDDTTDPSRRWHYFVPQDGEPQKLVSSLEAGMLDSLPGTRTIYRTWQEREAALGAMLTGLGRVAMEYSPNAAVPYVSFVDGGTLELVRSFGVEVVSSADLAQEIVSRWGPEQLQSHHDASRRLMAVGEDAFAKVARDVRTGEALTDFALQQFMMGRYADMDLISDYTPVVATNRNASDPHYEPTQQQATPIQEGDVLLMDFWAKRDVPNAVYADYTWMAYVGAGVPEEPARIFALVAEARDTAIALVRDAAAAGRTLHGWEVDDAARGVIEQAGYGDFFIHRTGHNINQDVHGEGANMDNYESHEVRTVLPNTCFSIEPGIYLADFGVRSEVNLYVDGNDLLVTGKQQQEMTALLA
jgi:Xaa-Pro dipeptidase